MASEDTTDQSQDTGSESGANSDSHTENKQQSDQQSKDQGKNEQQDGEQKSNLLEWAVGILGALIVLGTIGFLVFKIATGVGDPPNLKVTLGTPEDKGAEMIVPVEVENIGGSVAADAVIEACAGPGTCAQLTFNYIPHESVRKGNVGFSKPLAGPPTTRVVSYREP